MNKKYLKLGVLLVGLLAFFGGVNDAKADCKKVFSFGDCKYYGTTNGGAYEIELYGNDCDLGEAFHNTSIKGKDGGEKLFGATGNANKSYQSLKDMYDSSGCPSMIIYTTDNGTAWHDKMNIGWGTKAGSGQSTWKNTLVLYNVSSDYYDSTTESSQLGEEGVDVQIKSYNEDLKPSFEELYNILSGVDNDSVKINGKTVNVKLYNPSNAYDYADVISKEWKVNPPSKIDYLGTIGYNNYTSYFGDSGYSNLSRLSQNELKNVGAWGSQAMEFYSVVGSNYDQILTSVKGIKKLIGKSNALYKWGSGSNGHRALLADSSSQYAIAMEKLIMNANDPAKPCWFCNWLKINTKNSDNEWARNKVTNSIKSFSKYLQFNVEFEANGEKTTLLAQWSEYINSDIADAVAEAEDVKGMCDDGYKIAMQKGYDAAANSFAECREMAGVAIKSLSKASSGFKVAIKSFKADGFDWKEEDVVVTCENLLGNNLINMLSDIYFFIEVAVIIIVVILSMVDFFKATANSDADALKKCWGKIVKRIIVVIVLVLLPIIIGFTLRTFGIIEQDVDPICLDL